MLTPAEALSRILAALSDVAPLPAERVPLDAAPGRALAEDLVAELDLPGFSAATTDGYALRAAMHYEIAGDLDSYDREYVDRMRRRQTHMSARPSREDFGLSPWED